MTIDTVPRREVATSPEGTILIIRHPQYPGIPGVAIRRRVAGEGFWEVTGMAGPMSATELWVLYGYPATVERIIP